MLKEAWILHQAQTECTGTSEKTYLKGMIDLLLAQPIPGFDDLNWNEFDPQAPHPYRQWLLMTLTYKFLKTYVEHFRVTSIHYKNQ